MVAIEQITEVFEEVLSNFKSKCSKSDIKSKLSKMTDDEIIDALIDGGYLNDWEQEGYSRLLDKLDKIKDKDFDSFPPRMQKEIEKLYELKYQYDSRIFTHEKSNWDYDDLDKFIEEDQKIFNRIGVVGAIEQKELDLQNKNLNNVNWETYGDGTDFYGFNGYWSMNGSLVHGDAYWQEQITNGSISKGDLNYYKSHTEQAIKHLDYLMDNGGGLSQDVVLYRGGYLDSNLVPGMSDTFPCYSSTSYDKSVAESFQNESNGEYLIKIYAPKGTKGLHSGGKLGGTYDIGSGEEHEFTLKHGQRYVVLEKDDWNKTATIMLI